MSERPQLFPPPPSHPSRPKNVSSGTSSSNLLRRVPPPPPPARPVPRPPTTNATPAPVEASREDLPGAIEDVLSVAADDNQSISDVQTIHEEELTETQLRELYDEEEINRFLYLFSTSVFPIARLRPRLPPRVEPKVGSTPRDAEDAENLSGDEEDHWTEPVPSGSSPVVDGNVSIELGDGLAAWAASRILPLLPPAPPPAPAFSIKRARLAANRLFLALEPTYYPILKSLWDLATWKEYRTSLAYCVLYWWMWYNGLLLAGLMFRILYALLRRRFLPYPSLSELRQYRLELALAESFSRNVVLRIAASPAINVQDVWSTFKEYRASRKKAKSEENIQTTELQTPSWEGPEIVVDNVGGDRELGSEEEDVVKALLSEQHIWGPILHIANRIADIHERIKNIFLWRRPQVSAAYSLVLLLLAVLVAALPAKLLVRGATMGLGIFFWHVVPVLAALPPSERSRIPPPLRHSPTDAEYAMELISQRIARGLPVKPKRRKRETPFSSKVNLSEGMSSREQLSSASAQDAPDIAVNWDKWGGRVARTHAWAGDVKGVLKDGNWKDLGRWRSINPFNSQRTSGSQQQIETHTFPAQRGKSTGLITLAGSTLYFTPITSSKPDITIKLDDILGVKKSGVANGLKIRWAGIGPDGLQQERKERFLFVGDRDDLFARLVGWNAGKWLKA